MAGFNCNNCLDVVQHIYEEVFTSLWHATFPLILVWGALQFGLLNQGGWSGAIFGVIVTLAENGQFLGLITNRDINEIYRIASTWPELIATWQRSRA